MVAWYKNILKWIINPFLIKKRSELKVVVLCIMSAATFWLLNALNKNYSHAFTYPVKYSYNTEDFVPVNPLTEKASIVLNGQGWDLMKELLNFNQHFISINLDKLPGRFYVTEKELEFYFQKSNQNFKVENVLTDSLPCFFEQKVSKKIKLIIPKDSISIGNGFAIVSDINITPDSVLITGPQSLVKKMKNHLEVKINKSVISDFDEMVELKYPTLIDGETKQVNVKFDLDPYIQIEKDFEYVVINNENKNLHFTPKKLKGKYFIPEIQKNTVTDSAFKIYLDLKNFNYKNDTFLPVSEISKPLNVKAVVLEDSLIIIRKL